MLKQTTHSTKPFQLSMYELTTEYWNSYAIWDLVYKYFVLQNIEIIRWNKTKALALLKKHNK